MPSRISVELSPSSATDSITTLAAPASALTVSVKKTAPAAISTSPPHSAAMDHAHPHASPCSSASPSFSSSSVSSSPSSSSLSLPPSALSSTACGSDGQDKTKAKGKGKANASVDMEAESTSDADNSNDDRDRALSYPEPSEPSEPWANQDAEGQAHSQVSQQTPPIQTDSKGKGKGKGVDTNTPLDPDSDSGHNNNDSTSTSSSRSKSDIYTHSNAQSSNSSSLTSLSSADEKATGPNGKSAASQSTSRYDGASSGSGSSSSRPRMPSSTGQPSYMSSVGCSSGSGSGSGSGSSSKPTLNRSVTGPSGLQQSTASTLPTSGLQEHVLNEQDLISYEALPADFDYGDVPFYDTDPRTGIIYGDPRSIILPYLVPEKYFDLYRVVHDLEDPRKANVYNKYGVLLYYHPGRHIGQEQDSLRSNVNNQPIWTISGRTSTWGVLTAMELSSKRYIRITMESNKKKAATDSGEPLARFVFRWKDDDFVVEYRKQKDQYKITTSQMCGGVSRWKPPQPKPSQTMFHGIGMDAPGNPLGASTIGTPSPYDPSRYLQLISEYRLNSGPVRKEGDFELYNPDTFPPEFRTFLLLISIVVLDSMRPVDDKAFYKEFPAAALLKSKTATKSGFHTLGGPLSGVPSLVVVPIKEGSSSSTSLNADESSSSSTSVKATTISNVDVEPEATPAKPALRSRSKTLATSAPASAAAPAKKSRWASFFKK